jgi:hypothetical protein
MTGWRDALNGDPIPWLLEPDGSTELSTERSRRRLAEVNPSVRCFTLE